MVACRSAYPNRDTTSFQRVLLQFKSEDVVYGICMAFVAFYSVLVGVVVEIDR